MPAETAPAPPHLADPAAPVPYRVADREVETHDTATLTLTPVGTALRGFGPGRFAMLHARGVGEVAVSASGAEEPDGSLRHTVRDVGAVTRALHGAPPGAVIGVRGPFGTGWPLAAAVGGDLLVVSGGLGLAPLRPAVLAALADRAAYRRVTVLVGARSPADLLYRGELSRWAARPGLEVTVTVDRPDPGWRGPVGFVTEPLRRLRLDPASTTALLCGPEPMMRFTADTLTARDIPAGRIHVSLERNMQCGTAWCGHCQLGPLLLCRDGAVVDWATAGPLLAVAEL